MGEILHSGDCKGDGILSIIVGLMVWTAYLATVDVVQAASCSN
jgi:hypothetical protein